MQFEVVKSIPADRLMLETDCPWCEIRPTRAGFAAVATTWPSVKKERWKEGWRVKNRVEPEHMWQVLEVVAHARGGLGEAGLSRTPATWRP